MPQTKQLLLVHTYPSLCGFCKRIAPQSWDGSSIPLRGLEFRRTRQTPADFIAFGAYARASRFALVRGSMIPQFSESPRKSWLSLYRVYRRIDSLTKLELKLEGSLLL